MQGYELFASRCWLATRKFICTFLSEVYARSQRQWILVHNAKSIIVNLFNEFFSFTISRCLFQGIKGRFDVALNKGKSIGVVYVNSTTLGSSLRLRVVGSITDSIFRELWHKDNSYAFSVRIRQRSSDGNLTLLNTSLLNNENSLYVTGGFVLRLTKVTINSIYRYAIMASGPPKTKLLNTTSGIKVFLDDCLLADNRLGVMMATTFCFRIFCFGGNQKIVFYFYQAV